MNWQKSLKGKIRRREFLKKHTTFKIGGPADYFVEPGDISNLKLLIRNLKRDKTGFLVIGAGSNILVSDKGTRQVVICLDAPEFKKIIVRPKKIEAGAGASLVSLLSAAKKEGLSGLEFLAGIPGTVGGALAMNAGTQDKNIGELVEKVQVMDYNGKINYLDKKEIIFKYRSSGLAKYIILKASLKLKSQKQEIIGKRIKGYIDLRKSSQDLTLPSAGCVFKNPAGYSAGKLIDLCGLKGRSLGGACVSTWHANFIVNYKNAKASDVLKLMLFIRKSVKAKFNIVLEPEIKIWQ